MKLINFIGLTFAAQLGLVLAQKCDNSTGYYIDPYNTGTGDSSGSSSTSDGCNGDPNCASQLAALEEQGNANLAALAEEGADGAAAAAGVADCDEDPSNEACESLKRRAMSLRRLTESLSITSSKTKLHRRDAFACQSSQVCVIYGDLPLCLSTSTGDFTDATGGHGNLVTGTYTDSPAGSSIVASRSSAGRSQETGSSGATMTTDMRQTTVAQTSTTASDRTSSTSSSSHSATSSASASDAHRPASGLMVTGLVGHIVFDMFLATILSAYAL